MPLLMDTVCYEQVSCAVEEKAGSRRVTICTALPRYNLYCPHRRCTSSAYPYSLIQLSIKG